jgi:hypothetical protein
MKISKGLDFSDKRQKKKMNKNAITSKRDKRSTSIRVREERK